MKKHKNLFEDAVSFENLYRAYLKARKGKNHTEDVLRFTYNLENELFNLQHELRNGAYRTGKYRNFVIYEPKKRTISALPFRDRVVHHAICTVIDPIFERAFIYDSYACRKGKGTHRGAGRAQKFMRKKNCYVLKCDIKKYFPSINHELLKKIIRKKIADEKLLGILDNIIGSFKQGMPIGNLTSQLFANIYLNELDSYIKHKLRIKCYVRYMDDFVILDNSKQNLHSIRQKIITFLDSLKLELNPKKANIFPIYRGIDFLGYINYEDYKLARKSTVKRFLHRIKPKIRGYNINQISFEKLMESFNSWEAYLNHSNSHSLKKSLFQRYFKNVM